MDEFIYVFDQEARDALLKMGLTLLKSDERNKVYVFKNSDQKNFVIKDFSYITSNTLTF